LRAAHRAPNSVRRSLDRRLRVKEGQPVDLREVAVLTALAPSRRSRGRSQTPAVQIVPVAPTVRPSNPTQVPLAKLPLIVKKQDLPDPPGCRLRRLNPSAILPFAPRQAAPRPAAPQQVVHHSVAPALAGHPLVAPARAVPASSGRGQTGPLKTAHIQTAQVQGQIVQGQIRPDRTGPDQTGPVLIALPSTAPAAHAHPADPVAPVLAGSAPAGLRAPKATARDPLPPAPANLAPAEPDPPTNAPARPRQENRHGSPGLAAHPAAGRLLPVARNQPSVPAQSPEGFQNPAPATKPSPAEENPEAAHVPAANAPEESPEERSAANPAPSIGFAKGNWLCARQ
jgi:hypothetical protein